jgi:protein gp37
MGDRTGIEWADATWNPTAGCSVVSPGCTNCYAMRVAGGRGKHLPKYAGLTRPSAAGPVWTGEVRVDQAALVWPLSKRRPRVIFVDSMSDLFHPALDEAAIDQVFGVMALANWHRFIVLTKRADRMRDYLAAPGRAGTIWSAADRIACKLQLSRWHPSNDYLALGQSHAPAVLPQVAVGVSAEDQRRADERIPFLLETRAALRIVSLEPLLGPVDLTRIPSPVVEPEDEGFYHSALERSDIHYRDGTPDILTGRKIVDAVDGPVMERVDWVIAGGESGPGARPMHADWARSLRDQCQAAGVPFFFKQWGEWVPQVGAVDGWNINDDPEISRLDHRDWRGDRWGEPYRPVWCDERDEDTVSRVGKRAAGRLLDGREWSERPSW